VMPTASRRPSKSSRRRLWVALCAFALALVLISCSYKAADRLETAFHIKGGEAEAVDRELAQRFQSPYVHRLIVVIRGYPIRTRLKEAMQSA
jgi:RND superfamily putative drug exporter